MDGRDSQRAQETSRSIPTVPGREANLSAVQKAVGKPATDRERKEQALPSAEWPPEHSGPQRLERRRETLRATASSPRFKMMRTVVLLPAQTPSTATGDAR